MSESLASRIGANGGTETEPLAMNGRSAHGLGTTRRQAAQARRCLGPSRDFSEN
jgi:hypothetical protein